MITKFILNFSLFVSFTTLIYCVISDISMNESILRGVIVFGGFYLILIVFFIFARVIFKPGEPSKKVVKEQVKPVEVEGVAGE